MRRQPRRQRCSSERADACKACKTAQKGVARGQRLFDSTCRRAGTSAVATVVEVWGGCGVEGQSDREVLTRSSATGAGSPLYPGDLAPS